MEKAQEEGTGVNYRGKFKEDEKASEEGTFEQSNKELLEDRMKCIAVEIEEERSKKKTKPPATLKARRETTRSNGVSSICKVDNWMILMIDPRYTQ